MCYIRGSDYRQCWGLGWWVAVCVVCSLLPAPSAAPALSAPLQDAEPLYRLQPLTRRVRVSEMSPSSLASACCTPAEEPQAQCGPPSENVHPVLPTS